VGHHDCSTRARPDGIPTTAYQLTPAWLTGVLQPFATPASEGPGRVTTVEAAPLGVGLGLVGSLHRLDLAWTGGEGPQHLVAKLPARGMQTRAVASALDMYRNEVRFYWHLAGDTALAITCHHADVDDRTHDFVLILDDMSSATVVDQLAGCPHDRAVDVVVALADHHAGFWGETGLDGEPWLRRLGDAQFVDPFVAAFRATWPLVRSRFADDLDERIVTLGDRFADLMPALAADLSQPPCTLSHGDFRLDNMFFCRPGRIRLCDWQLTDRSPGPSGSDRWSTSTWSVSPIRVSPATTPLRPGTTTAWPRCWRSPIRWWPGAGSTSTTPGGSRSRGRCSTDRPRRSSTTTASPSVDRRVPRGRRVSPGWYDVASPGNRLASAG
jgi:hypothetical protein